MKLSALEKNLLAAARRTPPSEEVPYAFEKRVMAHLPLRTGLDAWAGWAQALWRGAASCALLMLALGLWSVSPLNSSSEPDLSVDLEQTVFASMDQQIGDSW